MGGVILEPPAQVDNLPDDQQKATPSFAHVLPLPTEYRCHGKYTLDSCAH